MYTPGQQTPLETTEASLRRAAIPFYYDKSCIMNLLRHMKLLLALGLVAGSTYGQDPSFSQFFSSPLNINPALTARINSDWRAIANFRDQWIGPASPYATGTISYDTKGLQNKIPNVHEEKNILGIG